MSNKGNLSPVLSVKNLSVSYGNKQVLHDVSMKIRPGECVGLIGPNGAGKTTLMRAVLGLVKPAGGEMRINEQALVDLPVANRAKYFGYLPQGGPIHWPMTVRSIVELGRMPHRHPWRDLSDADNTAVEMAMDQTDVTQFSGRLITNLSGGERARVMLARAIAVGAPFLLADEPAASLDPHYQLEMMALLKAQVSDNSGVIVVMHDLNMAQQFCTRLITVDSGRVIADGTPDSVLTDSLLADVFRVKAARWGDGETSYIVPVRAEST